MYGTSLRQRGESGYGISSRDNRDGNTLSKPGTPVMDSSSLSSSTGTSTLLSSSGGGSSTSYYSSLRSPPDYTRLWGICIVISSFLFWIIMM